jgi:DNA-binding NtrC family response regulator
MNLNVLFANDDVLTQWVMSEVLTDAGFTVLSACRGAQVIDFLTDAASDFDILLADLDLPDTRSACEIGNLWRRARPGHPVIYTGARRDAPMQPLQFHESFLETPFSPAALLRAIHTAVEEASFRPFVPFMDPRIHHVH